MYKHNVVSTYKEIFSAKILTPAAAWLNLEDLMLSELSQSQKDCMIPLI